MLYQFPSCDKINRTNYFLFDKEPIWRKVWASLPTASHAVYPVIGSHLNQQGQAYPGFLRIAIMAGIKPDTASTGIHALAGYPGLRIDRNTTNGLDSRHIYTMRQEALKERGRSFPFHKAIIEGGNWSQLAPTAKTLYPVLRTYSKFDLELAGLLKPEKYEDYGLDIAAAYPIRDMEFFEPEDEDGRDRLKDAARMAGILDSKTIKSALESLAECELIEWRKDMEYLVVYLAPKRTFKAEYLNAEVQKRYAIRDRRKILELWRTDNPNKRKNGCKVSRPEIEIIEPELTGVKNL
jgi:hypothetical protein